MKNPIKRLIPVILSVSLLLGTAGGTVFASAANAETNIIDNASLLPAYVPDDQVKLDRMGWPEWAKDIIIAEVKALGVRVSLFMDPTPEAMAAAPLGTPRSLLEEALANARPMTDDEYDDWLDEYFTSGPGRGAQGGW